MCDGLLDCLRYSRIVYFSTGPGVT